MVGELYFFCLLACIRPSGPQEQPKNSPRRAREHTLLYVNLPYRTADFVLDLACILPHHCIATVSGQLRRGRDAAAVDTFRFPELALLAEPIGTSDLRAARQNQRDFPGVFFFAARLQEDQIMARKSVTSKEWRNRRTTILTMSSFLN